MPLQPGATLGHYQIVESIGRGGMGEVFRARDPRVGREVAIKISGEAFGERFSREAQAIAALNHPNVCTLYDVGPDFLVMELIEGPTLAELTRVLFSAGRVSNVMLSFDVASDGQRFLLLLEPDGASTGTPRLTVVANWQALLRR